MSPLSVTLHALLGLEEEGLLRGMEGALYILQLLPQLGELRRFGRVFDEELDHGLR